ncbi:MAG: flagellar basal body rod protein FlgB [Magnetococcales bacterium]|nr:flagellar basal body rod protein FlgB [Magnetococcales bacterium]|tara:strand:+ start:503269 stop:503652 length:384 start_codon:yes stop_codon:yes gene_type:complete
MADVSLMGAISNRMDHLIARQGLVNSNIANANTPGYLTKDTTFEKLVAKQPTSLQGMKTTHSKHIQGAVSGANGRVFEDDSNIRHDGNSVKLDEEALKLNEIQLNYQMVTQLYTRQKQLQQLVVRSN